MLTFGEAWAAIGENEKPVILLGNGFSRAWNDQIFDYSNLLSVADFGERDAEMRSLFDRFGTYDFESIARVLLSGEIVAEVYGLGDGVVHALKTDQNVLKSALLKAISDSHPELPSDVTQEQYFGVRGFLSKFSKIFTVNYDILMYLARNKNDIEPLNWNSDDGFRAGQLWKGYGTNQNIFFLHGGLHIYETSSGVKKHVYGEFEGGIVGQVRINLMKNKFPLFVSEPTYQKKKQKIDRSPYLSYCLRELEGVNEAFFIYGHSFDENDMHIFNCVKKSRSNKIFVSIYGDENSEGNVRVKANALAFLNGRGRQVEFFDASTVNVWG